MENENFATFINGNQVDLVPFNAKYSELYCKWMNDPQVRKFFRGPFPVILDHWKKRYESQQQDTNREIVRFTIIHKNDNIPIGIIGLNRINWVNQWANAFIYIGEVKYWGREIATEATRLLLKYGFEELNLNKISGTVAVENIASWKIAEKVGFKLDGILKDEFYNNGRFIDVKKYRYLKKDWFNKKS